MTAEKFIAIDLPTQSMRILERGREAGRFLVSTASRGAGEREGSFCTPRGAHIIRAKIGAGAEVNTVFRGRRPTGEVYTPDLGRNHPERDWILTRILWLSGREVGKNRLGEVDTMRRHIYIHGAPDEAKMGEPGSIGCVRMSNPDILALFDWAECGTPVEISG